MAGKSVHELDERIADLYGLAPEDFVDARNALAKELRAQGERDAATEVSRLRRPTVAAWALNQVARRHPDAVAEIGEVGDELRRAQRRALSGVGADELRQAGARRRKVVERVASRADDALRDAGRTVTATVHQQVTETLEAATASEEVADALLRGRLERELSPDTGFGDIGALTLVPERPARPRTTEGKPSSAPKASDRATTRKRDDARARVDAAVTATRRAERDEQDAVAELDAAEHDADDAAAHVRELERALHDARVELDAARERVRDAKRERDIAQRSTAKARRAEDDARATLDVLDGE